MKFLVENCLLLKNLNQHVHCFDDWGLVGEEAMTLTEVSDRCCENIANLCEPLWTVHKLKFAMQRSELVSVVPVFAEPELHSVQDG